jgi:hypothetical protein
MWSWIGPVVGFYMQRNVTKGIPLIGDKQLASQKGNFLRTYCSTWLITEINCLLQSRAMTLGT